MDVVPVKDCKKRRYLGTVLCAKAPHFGVFCTVTFFLCAQRVRKRVRTGMTAICQRDFSEGLLLSLFSDIIQESRAKGGAI